VPVVAVDLVHGSPDVAPDRVRRARATARRPPSRLRGTQRVVGRGDAVRAPGWV